MVSKHILTVSVELTSGEIAEKKEVLRGIRERLLANVTEEFGVEGYEGGKPFGLMGFEGPFVIRAEVE